MLARDDKNSVLCEVSRDKHEDIAYSPYGYSTGGEGALGYNGERRETPGGRYLLGNGYRAFSPFLMRFHIPDNRSPFGDGGLNAYMYVMGDPVGYADETGHAGKLVRFLRGLFGRKVKAATNAAKVPKGAGKVGKAASSSKMSPVTSGEVSKSRKKRPKDVKLSGWQKTEIHGPPVGVNPLYKSLPSTNLRPSQRVMEIGEPSQTGFENAVEAIQRNRAGLSSTGGFKKSFFKGDEGNTAEDLGMVPRVKKIRH